jgi:hypothetical protein
LYVNHKTSLLNSINVREKIVREIYGWKLGLKYSHKTVEKNNTQKAMLNNSSKTVLY